MLNNNDNRAMEKLSFAHSLTHSQHTHETVSLTSTSIRNAILIKFFNILKINKQMRWHVCESECMRCCMCLGEWSAIGALWCTVNDVTMFLLIEVMHLEI